MHHHHERTVQGPVGIGDGPGLTNASLIKRSCMSNGTLLQPSKPFTAVDAAFASFSSFGLDSKTKTNQAFNSFRSVWGSYMHVSGQLTAYGILSVNITRSRFVVVPQDDFWPAPSSPSEYAAATPTFIHWLWQGRACTNGTSVVGGGCVSQVGIADTIDVSCVGAGSSGAGAGIEVHVSEHKCTGTNQQQDLPFALHLFTPYVHGFALLGEMDKFVPLSPARFGEVKFTTTGMSFAVRGAPQEDVLVSVVRPPGQIEVLPVHVPWSGQQVVHVGVSDVQIRKE